MASGDDHRDNPLALKDAPPGGVRSRVAKNGRVYSVYHNRYWKCEIIHDVPDDRRWFWCVWEASDEYRYFPADEVLPIATGYEATEADAKKKAKAVAGKHSRNCSSTFAGGFLRDLYLERYFRLHPESRPRPRGGTFPVSATNPAFATLGLTPPFSIDDVKAAYRAKVKEVHPDMGGDDAAFNVVESAYRIALVYCVRSGC